MAWKSAEGRCFHTITAVSVVQNLRVGSQETNAWERVRLAIIRRKNDLGMTNREFGRKFSTPDGKGHGDQWSSNLLSPKQSTSLSLQELDEAARILKTTAAELVRSPFDHSEYLTPTEHRILEAMRALPPPIRDHFLMLAEYLIGVAPDEIDHLLEFRSLGVAEKQKVQHWTHALTLAREPLPELPVLLDRSETATRPSVGAARSRRAHQAGPMRGHRKR